ncbi:MAG: polynucleotide kinase-phosphatase [Capsulimonas sp.]|uniref:polynucleotide kinase-phosphatase n=1 Tax=Capsulimonas sp. TaxID=2494211 RepID=UPI0032642A3A
MNIKIPDLALVVLVGASGSGKSTFARKHFKPTEVLSSDFCRGLVADDENDQSATKDAFEVLHYLADKRLALGRLTVIDATNVQPESRKPLVTLAKRRHCLCVAIVLNLPESVCHERNAARPDRDFGPHVVRNHTQSLRRSLRGLEREGFRYVFILNSLEQIEALTIEREPLWNNKKHEHGPFDIIGDVHGCFDELHTLLTTLGYTIEQNGGRYAVTPPAGRKALFVGDYVDRGPRTPDVLRLIMDMAADGHAICVPGNHDAKLLRKLAGKNVQITHGLEKTLEQMEPETPEFTQRVRDFIDGLVSHYVLDDGKLVISHAGLKESMQGRSSGEVRSFAMYGETTGETDEFGLPVRYNWASDYRGSAMVVYGHTPVPEPQWLNNTINIDTGCVFGGKLTALRYPERETVSVPAAQVYAEPVRPFLPDPSQIALSAQHQDDGMLEIEDVIGKRLIESTLAGNITIREENSIAALEVMSRFAADPRWLIYLPPTMSPCETSDAPDLLEHPAQAFAYYRNQGVERVVCEEKHMGSRAVVIVCRDEETARKRFGVSESTLGACVTRTGRRFFDDAALEGQFLERIRDAADASGLWDELSTNWMALDCELMPWSAKAQELVRRQYAAVGAAAQTGLADAVNALTAAAARLPEAESLLGHFQDRQTMTTKYAEAYRRYCWPVASLDDFKLAPFHLLATEGAVHTGKEHVWHMDTLARLCRADERLLLATPYRVVNLSDEASVADGVAWWTELTGSGGEGMVVKPWDFIARSGRGLVQPAVKCRGHEYLRLIYGPEYTAPANIERLRSRRLSGKRSLALREFALGVEALERFVRREPLRRVHECVFGVLALESEPVDPRL